jgi:hypothetical protein
VTELLECVHVLVDAINSSYQNNYTERTTRWGGIIVVYKVVYKYIKMLYAMKKKDDERDENRKQ